MVDVLVVESLRENLLVLLKQQMQLLEQLDLFVLEFVVESFESLKIEFPR